jgi:hypothetical protein
LNVRKAMRMSRPTRASRRRIGLTLRRAGGYA